MNFANVMTNNSNTTLTENGAFAYSDTGMGALVDLFGQIGALRPRTVEDIRMKFAKAFAADPLLATKMMFYCGNIRGGLGERRTFRICLKWMAENHPDVVLRNMECIPMFNRYDSLFELIDTQIEPHMWRFIGTQLIDDLTVVKAANVLKQIPCISLLAKWMPSENASSKKTKILATRARKALNMDSKTYRCMLSELRKHIGIVEALMSANEWDKISYDKVPSYAMKNYKNAFFKHDEDGFKAYLGSLAKGETKINASTLYPYDLVHEYVGSYYSRSTENTVTEAQWKALPNYVEGDNNYVVMADVSGSMSGRPMETSVGLAIYFAQHNHGDYHNIYMTFTDKPHYIRLDDGDSLAESVYKVMRTDVGYSTNLEAAFQKILDDATTHNIADDDMPKALIVISDMEIDEYYQPDADLSFVDTFKKKFYECGYELPKLVFWNVEARNDVVLGRGDDIIFISGQSISSFGQLCGSLGGKTAYEFMCDVLNDKMYDCVTI